MNKKSTPTKSSQDSESLSSINQEIMQDLLDMGYVPPEKRPKRNSTASKRAVERDRSICQCCYAFTENPEAHHIKPHYLGGESTLENLVTLCSVCHKGAPNNPDEFYAYQRMGGLATLNRSTKLLTYMSEQFPGMTLEQFSETERDNRGRKYLQALEEASVFGCATDKDVDFLIESLNHLSPDKLAQYSRVKTQENVVKPTQLGNRKNNRSDNCESDQLTLF